MKLWLQEGSRDALGENRALFLESIPYLLKGLPLGEVSVRDCSYLDRPVDVNDSSSRNKEGLEPPRVINSGLLLTAFGEFNVCCSNCCLVF